MIQQRKIASSMEVAGSRAFKILKKDGTTGQVQPKRKTIINYTLEFFKMPLE
jgi:hypothetical protein